MIDSVYDVIDRIILHILLLLLLLLFAMKNSSYTFWDFDFGNCK